MQIGQVPIQFAPNATINDTRAITLEPDTGDTLIPSLAPFVSSPAPVVETPINWNQIMVIGAVIAVVFWMSKPGR